MLIFLKLGGSLVTDKARAQTARPQTLKRLANEVASALANRPNLRILIGHGAGSFGHIQAHKHGTRAGVHTPAGWRGFCEVASTTALLNRLVFDILVEAGIPIFNTQPSASAICHDAKLTDMASKPIQAALNYGLVPLIHGDVAFDTVRGGTVISTEAIFRYLAAQLCPQTILIAGLQRGVLRNPPHGDLIPEITPHNVPDLHTFLGQSDDPDVTGGMENKVREMLTISEDQPDIRTLVFSGETPGAVHKALIGETIPATLIHAPTGTTC